MVKQEILNYRKRIKEAKMKKVILLTGLLLFVLVALPIQNSFAEPVANLVNKVNPFEKLELAGYFSNESSFKLAGEKFNWMKLKNIADIKSNYAFTDNLVFTPHVDAVPRFFMTKWKSIIRRILKV